MITQFSHVVHNQDDALEFYTKKVGFVVHILKLPIQPILLELKCVHPLKM